MNKKMSKTKIKLTYTLLFSIVGMLSGCQVVDNFFSDSQDTGYNYNVPKRRANTAPTVIYDNGNASTVSRERESSSRSYDSPSNSTSTSSTPDARSERMESSVPGIDMKPTRSTPKSTGSAIVPTEAPAVPSMAPTFAP